MKERINRVLNQIKRKEKARKIKMKEHLNRIELTGRIDRIHTRPTDTPWPTSACVTLVRDPGDPTPGPDRIEVIAFGNEAHRVFQTMEEGDPTRVTGQLVINHGAARIIHRAFRPNMAVPTP